MSLSRFDSYRQGGGSGDFSSYLEYLGKNFVESLVDQDTEVQRQRRSSAAAQEQREQKEMERKRRQVMKMTGLAASTIDEWLKWANSDPTSKILPYSTVRIL